MLFPLFVILHAQVSVPAGLPVLVYNSGMDLPISPNTTNKKASAPIINVC